jgi:hypothetical protein
MSGGTWARSAGTGGADAAAATGIGAEAGTPSGPTGSVGGTAATRVGAEGCGGACGILTGGVTGGVTGRATGGTTRGAARFATGRGGGSTARTGGAAPSGVTVRTSKAVVFGATAGVRHDHAIPSSTLACSANVATPSAASTFQRRRGACMGIRSPDSIDNRSHETCHLQGWFA